mmetsp:Transcript_44543/g.117695  ORF Transcript_44543/g.117695 Transcript_44543/m.117695 type:complete len:122 (+) Transcript_44543:165-530(+)
MRTASAVPWVGRRESVATLATAASLMAGAMAVVVAASLVAGSMALAVAAAPVARQAARCAAVVMMAIPGELERAMGLQTAAASVVAVWAGTLAASLGAERSAWAAGWASAAALAAERTVAL